MENTAAQMSRFRKMVLFSVLIIFLGTASAQGQVILAGDRSVPVEAKNGMVVTSHTLATEVALEVLKKGGEIHKMSNPMQNNYICIFD